MDKYITTKEMQGIIEVCAAMEDLWRATRNVETNNEIAVADSLFEPREVYDSNGETLGTIGVTDNGTFGLYLPEGKDE